MHHEYVAPNKKKSLAAPSQLGTAKGLPPLIHGASWLAAIDLLDIPYATSTLKSFKQKKKVADEARQFSCNFFFSSFFLSFIL